jgi:hypothetical protein
VTGCRCDAENGCEVLDFFCQILLEREGGIEIDGKTADKTGVGAHQVATDKLRYGYAAVRNLSLTVERLDNGGRITVAKISNNECANRSGFNYSALLSDF